MWPNWPRRHFAADGSVQGNKMRNMKYFIHSETFSLLHHQTNKHRKMPTRATRMTTTRSVFLDHIFATPKLMRQVLIKENNLKHAVYRKNGTVSQINFI